MSDNAESGHNTYFIQTNTHRQSINIDLHFNNSNCVIFGGPILINSSLNTMENFNFWKLLNIFLLDMVRFYYEYFSNGVKQGWLSPTRMVVEFWSSFHNSNVCSLCLFYRLSLPLWRMRNHFIITNYITDLTLHMEVNSNARINNFY